MLTLFQWISRLPLSWLQWLGDFSGRMLYRLSARERARVDYHLQIAKAYLPAASTLPRIAIESSAHSGRMLAESPWLWFRPAAAVAAKVECVSMAVLEQAEASGKGLLFLTPHIGSFDAAARWYATRRPVTVMYKPPKKKWLRPLMKAARNHETLSAAPANLAGLRQVLRALRGGGGVAILPDQVPTDGDGQWASFFGKDAYTMTLPQRLVELTGATVLLVLCERLALGAGWRLHIERLDAWPTPAVCNMAMQDIITRLPEQYLWSYNRYKRPVRASHAAPVATVGPAPRP
jgi:Kdo2-lipid IVA lauroyltransferase/acyltransferase